jgi:hypothetical protein
MFQRKETTLPLEKKTAAKKMGRKDTIQVGSPKKRRMTITKCALKCTLSMLDDHDGQWPIWMALRLNNSGDLAPVSKDAKSARKIVQFPQMFMTRKTAFIWFEISQNKHFSEVINAPLEVT